jgi:hypothetical protein
MRTAPTRLQAANPRYAASALLALGGLFSLIVEFPGSLEDDSLAQLVEGRSGIYSFWHPPAMSWLLGLADWISPGAGVFVVLQTILGFGALIGVVWLARKAAWRTAALAGPFCFLPQLFMFQGMVWKDVLFADCCLAGFVLIGMAAKYWSRRRLRYGLVAGSALFLTLAILTRQNGALFLPFAALALGFAAAKSEGSRRMGAWWGGGLLLAVAAAAMFANAALALRHDGTPAVEDQFKLLRLYDIAGIVKRAPETKLTVMERESPRMARLIRDPGLGLYSPAKVDTLEFSDAIVAAQDDTPAVVFADQWRQCAAAHPGAYLAHRAAVFAWLFWPSHVTSCHPFHVGVQGAAGDMRKLGIKERLDDRDKLLADYGWAATAGPAFWHPLYAALLIGALWLLLGRRRAEDWALAGLAAGALTFAASFFLIGIACDYRYLYVLDLSAVAAALYLAADVPIRKRGPETGPL